MSLALSAILADAPPFARVEVHADLAGAGEAFAVLQAFGGAYQTPAFLDAYVAAFGARLALVVARDDGGEPVALLPLEVRRRGPLTVAALAGGSWANYHMGLFRPGAWGAAEVKALLKAVGRAAGIDLFAFSCLPPVWDGRENPLARLPGSAGPSPAFATALGGDPAAWLDARVSKATQKKLRKKARKLEALGPVRHVRATGAQAAPLLAALYAQKAAQAAAREERDPFAAPATRALLARLAESGALEMHGLLAGERVAATFAALPQGRRLSGLAISYDGAAEVAAASPGEWLVIETARDAIARGFATLDLGVGDARYKRELCEIEEGLRDAAFGVTASGVLAARGFLAARAAKGWVKRRPGLLKWARRLKRGNPFG
jgi:CelD/BcsL family acetyltransferase involved in cellulose biosynthesis